MLSLFALLLLAWEVRITRLLAELASLARSELDLTWHARAAELARLGWAQPKTALCSLALYACTDHA